MSELRSTVEAKQPTGWIRTAGIGTMLGSVAVLAAAIIDNVTEVTSAQGTIEYVVSWAMLAIGAFLLLAGTGALYARYGEDYGRLGIAGTAIAGLGFLSMTVGSVWSAVYAGPAEASLPGGFTFAGLLLATLGSLVLGLGLRRANVVTRAAALLIAAPVVLVATFVGGETITTITNIDLMWILFLVTFCAGWVALGDALRYSPESTAAESASSVA